MAENTHLPVVNEAGAVASDPGKKPTVTLAELGARLPVGIRTSPGSLDKSFSVRPWKTKDERAIAKLKKPEENIAQYVALIVGAMCDRIGPHDFPAMSQAERSVILAQMYMGDVFYMYCYLRRQAMGSTLKMDFNCAHCSQRIPYNANLDTLEVRTVEAEEELAFSVDLQDPIPVRGREATKFQMTSLRWSIMETTAMVNQGSDAVAKIASVRGSVVGINDESERLALSDIEIDELSKYDLENLVGEINDHYVGPDMSIEDECSPEFCPRGGGKKFKIGIDWTYDSFFGISSR